jgi:hypothetical protein
MAAKSTLPQRYYAEAVATYGSDRRRPHGKAEDQVVGRKTDGMDRLANAN